MTKLGAADRAGVTPRSARFFRYGRSSGLGLLVGLLACVGPAVAWAEDPEAALTVAKQQIDAVAQWEGARSVICSDSTSA